MEKTNKILLNKTRTYNSVNVNSQIQIDIENTSKPIPLNDIDTTVSQFEQFEKERKESTIYRFYGQVTPIISNPLFNDNIKISENENKELPPVSKKIFSSDIFETDGWIGFYNDKLDETALQFNDNKSALCEFIPFDPGYDRLRILDSDGIPNYLFKITYPSGSKDITLIENTNGVSLKDGIPVIEQFFVKLNGRKYVGFKTAINHGLSVNDEISLLNFDDLTGTLSLTQKTYPVFKLGNQTNDLKFRTFIIDVNPEDILIEVGVSTIKRVVQNKPSIYYVREFTSLTSASIGDKGGAYYKDYDIYPAAFGTSYYNDKVASFNFKKDVNLIDLQGNPLIDNLGRPLTELYFTTIKNDSDTDPTSISTRYWLEQQSGLPTQFKDRFWTRIVAGYETENNEIINYNIRSFGDPIYDGNTYYTDIDESDEIFDGDIVEYNESELLERSLELVHHRVNTIYREHLNDIDSSYEDKKEGYIYKPFKKIQIREFANYINPIVDIQSVINQYNITNAIEIENLKKSFGVPDYATVISPNVYKWRDILEIGAVDTTGGGVDYPFESGAHYININSRFFFQRQDPPCEYNIVTEEFTLGATAPAGNNEKFGNYLTDPTFLNYSILLQSVYLINNTDNSTNPTTGELVFNTNNTIGINTITTILAALDLKDTTGYYRWSGSQWEKVSFSLDGVGTALDLANYNGVYPIPIEVNFVDFIGEYELGKRDIAGGCINLSLLKQKDVDDVC